MNSFSKNLLKALVFIFILILILLFLSHVFTPKDSLNGITVHDPVAYAFKGEPDNSLDVFFVGDSEIYASVIPMNLWQEYGITSFCCGTEGQRICYTEYFIKECLKKQSPELIVLEAHCLYKEFSSGDRIMQEIDHVFPLLKYHKRWKSLTWKDLDFKSEYSYHDASRGYVFYDHIDPAIIDGYMAPSDSEEKIPEKNIKYLERIKKFCDDRNVELMLLSVPSTINWSMPRHNYIYNLCNEMGIEYVDLNVITDELKIDWNNDTHDKGDHMNYNGAFKVTEYIGDLLADKGYFVDHHGDDYYYLWDVDADFFNNSYSLEALPCK